MKQDHPPIIPHGKAPSSTAHAMMHEDLKKHGAGHAHHSDFFAKHAAGSQYEQDKVKAMCGGGWSKK